MAVAIAKIFLSLGGTEISGWMKSFSLNIPVQNQDSTTLNDSWTEQTPGLKSWTGAGEFDQDFGAGMIDSILWPLHGTSVAVIYRPSTAGVGGSNPQYTGNAILSYDSIASGGTGDLQKGSFTLTGNGALARATA